MVGGFYSTAALRATAAQRHPLHLPPPHFDPNVTPTVRGMNFTAVALV
jgi:hypothetical protein